MDFKTSAPKGAVAVEFIEGKVTRFDGTTLSIAVGDKKPLPRRKFIVLMRKVVTVAKQHHVATLALAWADIRALAQEPANDERPWRGMSNAEAAELMATAFVMANYEHTTYKTKPKDGWPEVKTIAITGLGKSEIEAMKRGHWVANEVNACRELSNTPGGDMTPKVLVNAAKAAAKGTTVKVQTLNRAQMHKLGMGGVLGIAKGSVEEPQFIVMEYWGAGRPSARSARSGQSKPVVLIGKGVTFDTGGLQIKPGDHMYEMHMDMSGGAAVIHAIAAAAKLKLKVNVVGLIPAVENSPSGHAVRPGDILTSLSGKTIEILHTDAEGRVILADAITYAKRYNPALVADVATLTGAALVALGEQASAFMTNEERLTVADYMHLAEESGDYMWPMPMWEEYEAMTVGKFGDVPNISTAGNSRYGGVIAGGMFLWQFAKELKAPWIHIDMAPRMTSTHGEHLAKGAAGAPVRFLLKLIEAHAKSVAK